MGKRETETVTVTVAVPRIRFVEHRPLWGKGGTYISLEDLFSALDVYIEGAHQVDRDTFLLEGLRDSIMRAYASAK